MTDILQIVTTDAEFINSGDMRLVITGRVPTVSVGQPVGTAQPTTGALTLASDAPSVQSGTVLVPAGRLYLVGHHDGWGVGLELIGYAPTVGADATIQPPTGSLTLSEQSPQRAIGLYLSSDAPLVIPTISTNPDRDTLVLTGRGMTVIVQGGSSAVVSPDTVELAIVENSPSTDLSQSPSVGSLAVTGYAPSAEIDVLQSPDKDTLSITGRRPTITVGDGIVVIITVSPNPGTPITNSNASTTPSNYLICDRTGFKVKVKHDLAEEWTGVMVRADSYDKRHPQTFGQDAGSDRQEGALRPEPDDTFIDELYPDGVGVDDL